MLRFGAEARILLRDDPSVGTDERGPRYALQMQQAWACRTGSRTMSPILPISFLVTLLCAFGAIQGMRFQQLLFVGAALSATILVCSLEAWSAREIPIRSDDERQPRN